MLKVEYKVLKCIYKHDGIKKSTLQNKYKNTNIDDVLSRLSEYLYYDNKEMIYDEDGKPTMEYMETRQSAYRITRIGAEYVESRKRNFYTFFFPYVITTFIAILSLLTQLLPLLTELYLKLKSN